MKQCLCLGVVIVCTAGCSRQHDNVSSAGSGGDGDGSPSGSVGSVERPTPVGANVPIEKIVLQTRGARHGATNVDPTGIHRFVAPLTLPFEQARALIEQRGRFLDSGGAKIGCVVAEEIGRTPADSSIRVSAAQALKANAWYWLVIDVDERFDVADPDLAQVTNNGLWSTHFFTGSAPHIVRVEFPSGEKSSSPANVTFSEPINLGDVPGNRFFYVGAVPLSKCVLRGSECWSGGAWMSETANVALNAAQLPDVLTLILPGGVRGSGRTVGESRSSTSQVDVHSDGIRVSIDKEQFKPMADVSLWIEQAPSPAEKP